MAKTEERQELWGGETTKAVANFPVSGEPIPVPVARWLGRVKAVAARVNAELGLLHLEHGRPAEVAALGALGRLEVLEAVAPRNTGGTALEAFDHEGLHDRSIGARTRVDVPR